MYRRRKSEKKSPLSLEPELNSFILNAARLRTFKPRIDNKKGRMIPHEKVPLLLVHDSFANELNNFALNFTCKKLCFLSIE
jgi:hypothetical protein